MALKFNRLTKASLQSLKPGKTIMEHGITAQRRPDGDLVWGINIMVDGQRIHRSVGPDSEGVTRSEAERLIEQYRTEARENRLNLPKGRKLHQGFKEAAEEYLKRLSETDGKDMSNKRNHLRNHLIPHFGDQRIDQFTPFGLKQYRKKRTNVEGAAEATVNREFSTLKHFINHCIQWKWVAADKKPKIEQVREKRKQIRILSEGHRNDLLTAAIQDQESRLWLFVMIGLATAMRHSEIMRLRFDDIDFATNRIWIDKAKAGERAQPITSNLAVALKNQRDCEKDKFGWVFPSARKSKEGHRRDYRIPFARAALRAGLDPDKVTPHVMRHTGITVLVQAGIDLPTIQKISGHKTLAMVLHYTHVHGQHVDNAIKALDMALPTIAKPGSHNKASTVASITQTGCAA